MTIYVCLLLSTAEGWVLSKNSSILNHTAEGRRRGRSYQLTMNCGRHHGLTVVLARIKFSALLLLHGHNISGASMGGQYILKWGSHARSKWSKFLQTSNNHTQA